MQSERESTRRLRYNREGSGQHSLGTLGTGTLNQRERSQPGLPVPGPGPRMASGEPARANYPLRQSPGKERPGFSGAKPDPSTQVTRTGVSFDGTAGIDRFKQTGGSLISSPEQKQQLQFYPPHRSNFAKTYNKQSPLRNRSKSGVSGGRGSGGSGSRSKSRSLSNNRGGYQRTSAERRAGFVSS